MAERALCVKRPFTSPGAARRACAQMSNRIRVYWCVLGCHAYHVTHAERLGRYRVDMRTYETPRRRENRRPR